MKRKKVTDVLCPSTGANNLPNDTCSASTCINLCTTRLLFFALLYYNYNCTTAAAATLCVYRYYFIDVLHDINIDR